MYKQDLALNDKKRLTCHKTQLKPTNMFTQKLQQAYSKNKLILGETKL